MISDAFFGQVCYDILCDDALRILLKDVQYNFRPFFVNKHPFVYNPIAVNNMSAGEKSFAPVLIQTALYFLRELSRIVLGKSDIDVFQKDAVEVFCAVDIFGCALRGGNQSLVVFL